MGLKKFINFLILALSFLSSEDYYKQERFFYNHLVEKNDFLEGYLNGERLFSIKVK